MRSFRYEKPSLDQQRKAGKILGPPVVLYATEMPSEDAKESDFLLDGFDFDNVPDDVQCNIPILGERPVSGESANISESFTSSVFTNCTFNF